MGAVWQEVGHISDRLVALGRSTIEIQVVWSGRGTVQRVSILVQHRSITWEGEELCRVIWHKVGNDTATKVEDVVGLALSNSCVAVKNKPPAYLFASACLNVQRRVERGRMGRRREERRRGKKN